MIIKKIFLVAFILGNLLYSSPLKALDIQSFNQLKGHQFLIVANGPGADKDFILKSAKNRKVIALDGAADQLFN